MTDLILPSEPKNRYLAMRISEKNYATLVSIAKDKGVTVSTFSSAIITAWLTEQGLA